MPNTRRVTLKREGKGIGLSLVTQDVDGKLAHRISVIAPDGPAAKSMALMVGDQVLEVNGVLIAGFAHEHALAAFSMSIGDVILVVLEDTSPLSAIQDSLKPAVPLLSRKSSTNLLPPKNLSPKKKAPYYDSSVHSSRANSPVKSNPDVRSIKVQSNPSNGHIGISLVTFFGDEDKIRIGGVNPKGPAKSLDITPGDILVAVNGKSIAELTLEQTIVLMTDRFGQLIEIDVLQDATDFQALIESDVPRAVWCQRSHSPTLGLQLCATENGTRIFEVLLDTPATHSAFREGDRIVQVDEDDVTKSSHVEVLAVLSVNPKSNIVITVLPDKSPISVAGLERFSLASEPDQMRTDTAAHMMSVSGTPANTSKRGLQKIVTLKRGANGGLGMTLCTAMNTRGARIENLIAGSPASQSVIKIGDRILKANGMDLESSSHEEICAALQLDVPEVTLLLEEDDSRIDTGGGYAKTSPIKKNKLNQRSQKKLNFLGQSKKKNKKKQKEDKTDVDDDAQSITSKSSKSSQDGKSHGRRLLRGFMKKHKGPLDEYRTVKIPSIEGQGLGLKILTDERSKVARVSEVIEGKAAAELGTVEIGDRILKANNVELKGLDHDSVVRAMLQFLKDPETGAEYTLLELQTDKSELHDDSLRKTIVIHRAPNEGIGLKIHSAAQTVGISLGARISEIIPGRPAARVEGISCGDWLIEANGTNLERLSHDEIVKVLMDLKGTAITLVLEADDSPFEATNSNKKPKQNEVIGEKSMLSNIRNINASRDAKTNLLGFHFYSELGAGLPWTRVTGIDPQHPTSKTAIQNEDVIISIDGVDVLNSGHDVILKAFQGEGEGIVKMTVGRPPKNEHAGMYSGSGNIENAESIEDRTRLFPDLLCYTALCIPTGLLFKETKRHLIVVDSVEEKSPAQEAGVQTGDYLVHFDERSVLNVSFETLEDVLEAAIAQASPMKLILGRPYIYEQLTLERAAGTKEELKDKFEMFGFAVRSVNCGDMVRGTYGGYDTGTLMVCGLLPDGIASNGGVKNGDVVYAINDVPLYNIDGSTVNSMLGAYDGSVLELAIRREVEVPRCHVLITKEDGQSFGFGVSSNPEYPGAVVSTIGPDSLAAKTTLKKLNHIERINGDVIGLRQHKGIVKMLSWSNAVDLTIGDPKLEPIPLLMQLKSAVLERKQSGFGMKLVTKDDGNSFPRVSFIEPNGVAHVTGKVSVGDRVISCNGNSMAGISSKAAKKMMFNGNEVYLQLVPDDTPFEAKEQKAAKAAKKALQKAQYARVGAAHLGCRVEVKDVPVPGTLRWYGNHKLDGEARCGVELDTFEGKTFGSDQAQQYFSSPHGTGILATPDKVSFVEITEGDVGKRVRVAGIKCLGKLIFYGPHHVEKTARCGVILDKPLGNCNGTIKNHKYFQCKEGCGLLVKPEKVYLYAAFTAQSKADVSELLNEKSVDETAKAKSEIASVPVVSDEPKTEADNAFSNIAQMAEEMKRLMEEGSDDEDLPELPPDGGDELPDVPDSDDDDELPDIPDDDDSDGDDELPDIPDEISSGDESLPEMGSDDEDDELPPGPESTELDLDFADPFLLGYDAKDDTEV